MVSFGNALGSLGFSDRFAWSTTRRESPEAVGKVGSCCGGRVLLVRAPRHTNLEWSAGISTNTIATTGLLGLISRGYFWKMVRQEVFEEADNFSLKQVT